MQNPPDFRWSNDDSDEKENKTPVLYYGKAWHQEKSNLAHTLFEYYKKGKKKGYKSIICTNTTKFQKNKTFLI